MRRRAIVAVCTIVAVLGAGCSSGDDEATQSTTVPEPTTTAAPATTALKPPPTVTASDGGWVQQVVDPATGCKCSDGSEFSFWTREANPDKVMLYFQGGGACFSEETCASEGGTYQATAEVDGTPGGTSGIFDFDNPANPIGDWSVVFVPYCTGDLHLGDELREYSDTLTINHVGYLNATKGLDYLTENFGDAAEVFVTGSSAGGVPSPLFGGLAADAMPDARVSVLADASGAYPNNPPINEAIGALWGTFKNLPDWPEVADLKPRDWSIPGLFTQAGLHNPAIHMARFDNAFDATQEEFVTLASLSTLPLEELIVSNEAEIEADGVPIASYIAPGVAHTILGRPSVYTTEVAGVLFIEWLRQFIAGDDVADVTCVKCE